ncbi:hypothetical protein [Pseudochrobactrum asaccharolyticum]|uniref:Uncharacterized protein n=1 Tax=Pseudochrobactrum asaccharolyticum TaxID=354351 RepID=A0A366DTS1_9HYPH|nr:hypothetical protein [Pseudochrobactrum asaccharolyticum]RBO93483.1 hypothetical protein DFR47_105202 [Pseudochrobactrum asaccharolyticum]
MSDWSYGGWTGSINRVVRREVKEHFKANSAARGARYSLYRRLLRYFLKIHNFWRFLAIYVTINTAVVLSEILSAPYINCTRPDWPGFVEIRTFENIFTWLMSCTPPSWLAIASTEYVRTLLLNVGSYFITAQVGALGILSLALALVTLIAQGQNSETDVKVYYHESHAFEIVSSSLALLSVLCIQLLWPVQFLIHKLGWGSNIPIFKLILLTVHLTWLLINLASFAHFISVTFGFVQQSKREQLRELFTANVVMPMDMQQRLRRALYSNASETLLGHDFDGSQPNVIFGYDYGKPQVVEISSKHAHSRALIDVRMVWVRWVARRWRNRCIHEAEKASDFHGWPVHNGPLLLFVPKLDFPRKGKYEWCLRRGGVPLTRFEKIILRAAFKFKRVKGDV